MIPWLSLISPTFHKCCFWCEFELEACTCSTSYENSCSKLFMILVCHPTCSKSWKSFRLIELYVFFFFPLSLNIWLGIEARRDSWFANGANLCRWASARRTRARGARRSRSSPWAWTRASSSTWRCTASATARSLDTLLVGHLFCRFRW